MKQAGFWMASAVGFFVAAQVVTATTLDYQGRLTSEGQAFSGAGFFKFELQDADENVLWRNDGSIEGREPEKAVRVEVEEGLFTVELGSDDPGMVGIPAVVFHSEGVVLRTWFSDNRRGDFERLRPDVAIRSMGYGQLNTGDMVVVDEVGGDLSDLQAAVNLVATNDAFRAVLVMPGRYVLSAPLTTPGRGVVTVRGMGRDAVLITHARGAVVGGFNGTIEGVSLLGSPAVDSTPGGRLTLRDCTLRGSDAAALNAGGRGALILSGCRVSNPGGAGIAAQGAADVRVLFSEVQGTPAVLLRGTDAAAGKVPELVQCVLNGAEDVAVAVTGGGKGDISLMNSTLYGAIGEGVSVVPAGQSQGNGNVVVSASGE